VTTDTAIRKAQPEEQCCKLADVGQRPRCLIEPGQERACEFPFVIVEQADEFGLVQALVSLAPEMAL